MARTSLPLGFRFHPTDVELIMYYLKRKVMGKKFVFEAIAELNIYNFGPWDLADKSLLRSKDLEWYFFAPREKKYANGARANRAAENGYWKATGKDRSVIYNERTVGMIKTLIFYKGHAPKGERTDWVMHEYRIEDKNLADVGIVQDSYMLCKVFQKSGVGPKNNAHYGAPFDEDEWNDLEEICADSSPVGCRAPSLHLQPNPNNSVPVSLTARGSSCSWPISEPVPSGAGPSDINTPSAMADPPEEDVVALLAGFTEDSTMLPIENKANEVDYMLCQTLQKGDPVPKNGVSFNQEVSNNMEEICAESSPVDEQLLFVNLQTNQSNSDAMNLTALGTSFSWPINEPGPSVGGPSSINMPSDMGGLLNEDVVALLAMFTEDGTMHPVENNINEKFTSVHGDMSIEPLTCSDGNDIYNGPFNLNNWTELRETGFNFSNTWDTGHTLNPMVQSDDTLYLELKDLDTSLKYPAEASESQQLQTGSSYDPNTCYQNLDESYCEGNHLSSVQDVSGLIQSSALPEGSHWLGNNSNVLRKENGGSFEAYKFNAGMGNGVHISYRQPEGRTTAEEIQRRGSFCYFQ